MRALAHMMGPTDRNQDPSQRSQLTPLPSCLIMRGLLRWLCSDSDAQLNLHTHALIFKGWCVLGNICQPFFFFNHPHPNH